ncbi:MAG: Rv3235 family protein [Bowdeniella nasicola]|nr:Rv3235 family protein [Bowdeniella nasicola]
MTATAPIAAEVPDEARPWDPLLVQLTSAHDYVPDARDRWEAHRSEYGGSDQLPHPRAWAHAVLRATLEVLTGYRPVTHLQRWVSPMVYSALCRRAALALRVHPPTPRQRPQVRSVQVSSVARGRVDVIATIRDGERTRAVALELMARRKRWVVSEIVVG